MMARIHERIMWGSKVVGVVVRRALRNEYGSVYGREYVVYAAPAHRKGLAALALMEGVEASLRIQGVEANSDDLWNQTLLYWGVPTEKDRDMEITVKRDNRSLAEHYSRCSGTITVKGETYFYEYGEYPEPVTLPDGTQDETLVFRVKGVSPALLIAAGVWNASHLAWWRERFTGVPRQEIERYEQYLVSGDWRAHA